MKFKTITYGKSATKNTGDYENIKINFEATVEVGKNESVEEAQAILKGYVDTFLNEEINKYSEGVNKDVKSSNVSKRFNTKSDDVSTKEKSDTKYKVIAMYETHDGIKYYHFKAKDSEAQFLRIQHDADIDDEHTKTIQIDKVKGLCMVGWLHKLD